MCECVRATVCEMQRRRIAHLTARERAHVCVCIVIKIDTIFYCENDIKNCCINV